MFLDYYLKKLKLKTHMRVVKVYLYIYITEPPYSNTGKKKLDPKLDNRRALSQIGKLSWIKVFIAMVIYLFVCGFKLYKL